MTHGDFALEAEVVFQSVVEHRLIPHGVRSEWSRLRTRGLASIWSPASQDSSHVGNAGVWRVSTRGGPIALPSFATALFRRFFDCAARSGSCFPWAVVGSCIWSYFMGIRVLIVMLGSLP